jgi:hypothetical protein
MSISMFTSMSMSTYIFMFMYMSMYMFRYMDMYYTCACNDTRRCSRTGRFMYINMYVYFHVTWPARFQDCVWPTLANPNRCMTAQDPRYSTVHHKLWPDCPWLTVYRPVHDQPLERCLWPIVTGLFCPIVTGLCLTNCYRIVHDQLLHDCVWTSRDEDMLGKAWKDKVPNTFQHCEDVHLRNYSRITYMPI